MTAIPPQIIVVEAVSLARAEVVLADGSIWPITTWLDDEGDHCSRDDATVAVAGTDRTGYTVVVLADFQFGAPLH